MGNRRWRKKEKWRKMIMIKRCIRGRIKMIVRSWRRWCFGSRWRKSRMVMRSSRSGRRLRKWRRRGVRRKMMMMMHRRKGV